MTDTRPAGCLEAPAPLSSFLPPGKNGYRRKLHSGRGINVHCDRHSPNEWAEHWHAQDQISGVLDDVDCEVRIVDSEGKWKGFKVRGPAIWVIPKNMIHTLVWPSEADMLTLYPEPDLVRECLENQPVTFEIISLPVLVSRDEIIGHLSSAFRRFCREPEIVTPFRLEAIGTLLATHVLRAIFVSTHDKHSAGGLLEAVRDRMIRHIALHLNEKLLLGALAKIAGYQSTSHFGRLFRRSFGMTPHDYLVRQRVARAREMLKTSPLKEVEIAQSCGFSDDTAMGRAFRRVSDQLPSDNRPKRIERELPNR